MSYNPEVYLPLLCFLVVLAANVVAQAPANYWFTMSSDAKTRWAASMLASAVAETLTLPLDFAKTRLQLQSRSNAAAVKLNLFQIISQTYAKEGAGALWKGLSPALLRQCCYTSLSMVLYNPFRDALSGASDDATLRLLLARLVAGGCAGGVAIFCFNWADVLKVKIQASSDNTLSVRTVFSQIYAKQGIAGFWSGVKPNVMRTFVVNAAELGSYDQIKTEIFIPLVGNTPLAHIGSSGLAGVISALVSTPLDVVKTRWMNEAGTGHGHGHGGMLSRGMRIVREEGFLELYSGFFPICFRKVCWCTAFFVSYEALQLAMGSRGINSLT